MNYCVACRLLGLVQIKAPYIINGFSLCGEHECMWGEGYMTFKDGEPVDYDIEEYKKEKAKIENDK